MPLVVRCFTDLGPWPARVKHRVRLGRDERRVQTGGIPDVICGRHAGQQHPGELAQGSSVVGDGCGLTGG